MSQSLRDGKINISYWPPSSSLYEDISVYGANIDDEFTADTRYGSDIIHGNDEDNSIRGQNALDVLYGYGGMIGWAAPAAVISSMVVKEMIHHCITTVLPVIWKLISVARYAEIQPRHR